MIQYTKAQKQAVQDERPGNILVSASAGSGKTRVLVDRVIHKVLNGTSIDQLLIVTFTKAAAKEMRDRIQTALREQLKKTTDNQQKNRLITQLRKVPVAYISTFDAFCQRIIQHYYYIINLDPNFRILNDNTEREMMRENVWNDVREDLYANDSNHKFADLTENFSGDRDDDGLMDLVYQTYDYANVNQNPSAWLDHISDMYHVNDSITQSDFYQKSLLPVLLDELQNSALGFESALRIADREDQTKDADQLKVELETVKKYQHLLKTKSWDELKNTFQSIKFKNFPSVSKKMPDDQKSLHDQAKDARNAAKKQLNQIGSNFFELSEKDNLSIMKNAYGLIQELIQVVHAFSNAYQQYKKEQHVLEFIDIEHDADRILNGKQDKAKAVRANLTKQFNEIMVDEYQDNNRLQDQILSSIAKPEGNLFMVGDVKQSIYRFRLADPKMFMNRSKKYSQHPKNGSRVIHLAENFRSDRNVISFVNMIFKQIMDERLGGIDYYDSSNNEHPNLLKVGATYYPADLPAQVDVLIYNSHDQDSFNQGDPNENTLPIKDSAQGQIELVAQKIKGLISKHAEIFDRKLGRKRPMQYHDIAILSSTHNNNLTIADIFHRYQLPVKIDDSQKYFKTTEIQIMMSLLSIIDNPYQDIPLAAVLRSPIVQMDENQMAYLRINQRSGDYFNALKHFYHTYGDKIENSDFGDKVYQKVQAFLEQLTDFRNVAQQHELVDLIWYIYQQTGFLDYVGGMPSGKQRQANLHALYDRAAEYEKTSFKGLFQFVRFVRRIQEHDDDLAAAQISHTEDAINVMTIHRSKGLEFPVVFLIDAAHQFNFNQIRGNFVLNDRLGLGMTYFNPKDRVNIDTLQKQVIVSNEKNADLSEEMRKLYVAMTRAEQRLFIVGAIKNASRSKKKINPVEKLLSGWENEAMASDQDPKNPVLNFTARSHAKNDLDLIGPALVRHPDFKKQWNYDAHSTVLSNDQSHFKLQFIDKQELAKDAPNPETQSKVDLDLEHYDPKNVASDSIKSIMDFQYPNQMATHTTAYQSVSEIKRLFDDPDNLELGNFNGSLDPRKTNRYTTQNFNRPQFMQTVETPQSTDIGTATHLVLQKLNVEKPITLETVQQQINDLVKNQLVTPEVAQKIDANHIMKFYQSSIGKIILKHPRSLHREVPFSLLISANRIFKDFRDPKPKVLIHGIIDGYLDLDDKVILFDYKTDYVRDAHDEMRINKIIKRYQGQVNLYGIALKRILHRPVDQRYLYLLSIDRPIPLNEKK
ncbi:ATP-dependent helicase/nuclease subunit A [Philodulcilactobacillus myokoensis]|uniref:ATP-dependent helicase/nuclease subunit A n=1 Tax=Philodulcilactobacillus myokoensis TaxID=2929573 RepID=A0A9W6AYN4_9LACO|nr:helicase-exonuclease AddAB subunit AddA [Philodulcilactobacillus myokoensis]GLB46032.1 ATP-dependent helicase/nuclease subunit A [Philodulcilactobacillus myokoensis]